MCQYDSSFCKEGVGVANYVPSFAKLCSAACVYSFDYKISLEINVSV